MSATWRWLVAGLVAAVVLFGVGWWMGHRSVTTSAADAQTWRDSTDVLLGKARKAHAAEVDSLLAVVAVTDSELIVQENAAAHHRARAARSSAAADSLSAVLAEYSEIPIDSLAIYPVIVALQDSTIAAQDSAIAVFDRALTVAEQSRSVLLQVVAAKNDRIAALEGQLTTAPKPERFRFRFLGGNVEPGLFAGVTPTGRPTAGVGVVITR